MTDTPKAAEGLRPANENPWYILMTLYGEQEGEEIDWELLKKNRRAWNAWTGQALGTKERAAAAESSEIEVAELDGWEELSEEIEARFAEEYQRRNPEADNVPDLPDPKDLIDMSKTTFSKPVVLEKVLFASTAGFQSSTFMRHAWFDTVTFMGHAWFDRVTFKDHAWFVSATFRHSAGFISATFAMSAWFDAAVFSHSAWLGWAKFSQDASFHMTTFEQMVSFDSANFSGFAYFTMTRFGGSRDKPCIPNFSDCQFEKSASFRQAQFRDGYPGFSGAVLHDKTSFTARRELSSDEIAKDDTLIGQTYWPKTTKQNPVNARESCAIIRHVLTQQGLPEEAHFFFRREMHFAGLPSEGRSWTERLPYRLFGWFSDYGYSIQRPLWWLAGVWFAGLLTFAYLFGVPQDYPKLAKYDDWTAMGLSFSNLFPLFGFGRVFLSDVLKDLPRWAQVLSGAQTVLSLPLLFFLGLGLRQRFRLR